METNDLTLYYRKFCLYNIKFKILFIKFNFAKKLLNIDPNFLFYIIVYKKHFFKNTKDFQKTAEVALKDELNTFKNNEFVFNDIDIENEYLEIKIKYRSNITKEKEKPIEFKLKDMIINRYKEEIFQFNENILINYHYIINSNRGINICNELSLEKPKILKKIHLDLQRYGLDKRKFKSSKSLTKINTIKESVNNGIIDCNIYVTENNNTSSDTYQFTNLNYENVILNNDISHETFADVIFLTGLPKKGSKVIQDSEKFNPVCMHKECSILQSYKPEILYKVAFKDSKDFILNSSVASFSFPMGIKICYTKDELRLKPQPNYFTVITNEFGQRYYLSIVKFYKKIDYISFKKEYDFDAITDYFQYNKLMELVKNENSKKNMNDENMIFSLMDNDHIYLPYSLCIISKYPYIKQFEICLETILKLLVDDKQSINDINKFIIHLLYEIPIPPINKKLSFFIPYNIKPIEIYGNTYKDLPILTNDIFILFEYLSIENIIMIHILILLEQKILFIYDNCKIISELIQSFIYLLYPFQWNHIYIPILSEDTYKYVLAFMPYIMGLDESIYNLVKGIINENSDNIFIVNIKKKIIEVYKSNKIKKINKKRLFKIIPEYPNDINEYLTEELIKIKKDYLIKDNIKIDKEKLNKKIRSVFVKSFVYLLGDYRKYVSFINDIPLLNKHSFMESKSNKDFYNFLIETHNFSHFIQDNESFPYFDKICTRLNNTSVKKVNSKKNIISFKSLSNSTKTLCRFNEKNSESFELSTGIDNSENKYDITGNYMISPYFLAENVFTNIELIKIEELITNKFKYVKNYNLSYFNSKIFQNLKDFVNINIPLDVKKYLIPNNNILRHNSDYNYSNTNNVINKENNIIEEYKNSTIEYLKMILTSVDIESKKLNCFETFFSSLNVRNYFASKLYQDKFNQNNFQVLTEKGFEDLSNIIYKCLLYCNNEISQYYDIMLITKSCFYYYKLDKFYKNVYFIYQDLVKRCSFSVWSDYNFWNKWFENETKNIINIKDNLEDYYFSVLLYISNKMLSLNLDLKMILDCLIDKIGFIYIKSDFKLLEELKLSIIKHYNNNEKM